MHAQQKFCSQLSCEIQSQELYIIDNYDCGFDGQIPSNGKAPECKEDVEIPEATKCGIGPYNPQCLQIFASKKFFTFMLCIFGLIEGALISGEQQLK